jgi:hypothetical protein
MKGNSCPKCGNPVIPFVRFLHEAEPYRTTCCQKCGAMLKRPWPSYVLMVGIIIAVTVSLFLGMADARVSFWIVWPAIVLWISCFTFITHYWLWRYIPWQLSENTK